MYRKALLSAAFLASICITGCNSQPAAPPPGQTGSLPVNGQVAPDGTAPATATGTAAAPAPVVAAPAPARAAVAPAPKAPVVRSLTVPDGTSVHVRTTGSLSSKTSGVGEGWSGVLNSPIAVDGVTVFPRGTEVSGTVIASKGQGRFKGAGALGIDLNTIGGLRVSSTEYEVAVKGKGKRSAGFIAGGAGLGALIGGLTGGGKGAAIGAAAGGGAGTAGAAFSGNKDVVIPSESLITFTLTSPVTVRR